MSDVLAADKATPRSDADLQTAIREMAAELGQINARIERHQTESDRIGAETRVMLDALNGSARRKA